MTSIFLLEMSDFTAFYRTTSKNRKYWKLIFPSASSETITDYKYLASHAFDFQDTHWTPLGDKNESKLTICFLKHRVTLTKYSITPPANGTRMGHIWSFAGSNDNITYYDEEVQEFQLINGIESNFEWKHGPYRCLQLTVLGKTSYQDFKFDIQQLEFFGTIERIRNQPCSCFRSIPKLLTLFFVLSISD